MYAQNVTAPRRPGLVREHAVDYGQDWGDGAGQRLLKVDAAEFPANADELPSDGNDLGSAADKLPTNPGDLTTDSDDELFLLGERCAQAYMRADALQYQAMRLLAEFDHREGWHDTGFSSTAEWLAWRIGITSGAARERVRTALALEALPETSEAMSRGEISFTKVRALTRAAKPESEAELLDLARAGSAANLERVVRGWKTLDGRSEVTAEQIRHRSRRFSAFVDNDGMVVVRGRLDPEVGAVFMRAVEAASDALYKREWDEGEDGGAQSPAAAAAGLPDTTPEQRRADAVGLMAERALAAGFGEGDGSGNGNETRTKARNGKGKGSGNGGLDGNGSRNGSDALSGSRAERYQVMLHVDAGTLKEDGEPGMSELEDGTRVSAETSRRLGCDASRVTVTHGPDGEVLGAGRRSRTVNPSIRRALEARDRGCRFPGCGLRFTEAHHVKHWADGGETSLRNMVLLCRRHHRAVHEGGVRVAIDATQQVVFFTPRGKALFAAPPRNDGLLDGLAGGIGGIEGVGGDSGLNGTPRFKFDSDIPWAIEARAWEALDSG